MSKQERLPRSDIPPDYKCPYPACSFQPAENKRGRELTFRNHMAQVHGVYYEKAEPTETSLKLAKYARHSKDYESLAEISQLASWHCAALARHEVTGIPLTQLARENKHSADTLLAVAKSPAGQRYTETIRSNLHDPVKTVKDLLASGMVSKLLDWEQAWQWAVEAKNADLIHKMAKDIGLQPALDTQEKVGPTKISLHLNMGGLDAPIVKTSFTVVDDPTYEVEEEATDG